MRKLSHDVREQIFSVLMRVSLGLCIMWLLGTLTIGILAQQRLSQGQDVVTLAEHEKLKGELSGADAAINTKIAVLDQQVHDMHELLILNTSKIADLSTTINREEGLGLAFGLALGLVQWWLYRTHEESNARWNSSKSDDEPPQKRPSGDKHKVARP